MATSHQHKIGQAPGTLQYTGVQKVDHVTIEMINYDADMAEAFSLDQVEDCQPHIDKPGVSWLNVSGLHDVEVIAKVGEAFDLHPLLLEDVLNTSNHPKLEHYDDYLFFTIQMLHNPGPGKKLDAEQVSFVLGKNYVISFQERPGDVFEPIRDRIHHAKGRVRSRNADYLVYLLTDAVVDNYYLLSDYLDERVEMLEAKVMEQPDDQTIHVIQRLKQKINTLKKVIQPLKDALKSLENSESKLIQRKNIPYFRDILDHTLQIIGSLESNKEMLMSIMEVYQYNMDSRMNNVMKTLTIVATIFIPLTFMAGIYGMNFEHMPELAWKWSYPIFWTIIVIMTTGMVIFFKTRKWL